MRSSRVSLTLASAAILTTLLLGACHGNDESRTMAPTPQTFGASEPSLSELDCTALSQEYALAVQEARACDLGTRQCTLRVASSLFCACPIYVNPRNKDANDKMKSVLHAWYGGGCSKFSTACLMSLCRQTKDSVCTAAPADPSQPVVGICPN